MKNPEKYAGQALLFAWAFLDFAATFVASKPAQTHWESFLNLQIQRGAIKKELSSLVDSEAAAVVDKQIHQVVAKLTGTPAFLEGQKPTGRGVDPSNRRA